MPDGGALRAVVRLRTRLGGGLEVPAGQGGGLEVPLSVGRAGLSQLVNALLGLGPAGASGLPARAFAFAVEGRLLTTALGAHLERLGCSVERALDVEYFLAAGRPRAGPRVSHPDWVAALDGSLGSAVVSGGYDGVSRVFAVPPVDAGGAGGEPDLVHELGDAGAGAVHAVAVLEPGEGGGAGEGLEVLSGGASGRVALWRGAAPAAPPKRRKTSKSARAPAVPLERAATLECGWAISCLGVSPLGGAFCAGGWGGDVLLWDKDAALAGGGAGDGSAPAPRQVLKGHAQNVAGLAWNEPDILYSASWDHSVRRWDLETGTCTQSLSKSNALYTVAASRDLVLCGGSDWVVRVWDVRAKPSDGRAAELKFFAGHKGWVSQVAWCPEREHVFASASHDGTVRLWDTRGSSPLHAVQAHEGKALCLSWLAGGLLASGGTDCQLALTSTDLQREP